MAACQSVRSDARLARLMPVPAQVLPTHTRELFDAAVREAVWRLRAGQVVALPTETVYGLAANALDPAAVAAIFAAKGRPAHNPVIVHVAGLPLARACVDAWPAVAERLAEAFWPGPLTLVLPKASTIPPVVTAGGTTVGVRWPSHPLMQAVIRQCGFPLAAPSANPANELSPTTAGHVLRTLGDRIPLIVDAGPCRVGIESTVIDLSVTPPRVLRPGMVGRAALESVIGAVREGANEDAPADRLRSPGQLPRHYAPRARLVVTTWRDTAEFRAQLAVEKLSPMDCWALVHSVIPSADELAGVSVVPHDAEAYARALYAELHQCDERGVRAVVVEAPPAGPEWDGIADRLRRASTPAA